MRRSVLAGIPMESQCGDCEACVKVCPPHAFTGRMFREDEDRSARYDARACEQYIAYRERAGAGIGNCGLRALPVHLPAREKESEGGKTRNRETGKTLNFFYTEKRKI
jgi:ferredoxin